MFRAVVCVAVFLPGCAVEPPTPIVRPKTVTKIVTEFKTRTCTTTTVPMSKAEFCRTPKACPKVSTCGEAYYRYTTCGEIERDGGVAGVQNGVPCENVCGTTALAMAAKIRSEQAFTPPMASATVCTPSM